MGEFESVMREASGESLTKKPGIKEAYKLIDDYGRKLKKWDSMQEKANNGFLLWNLKKSVLQQSRTWDDGPTKWELRRAVNMYPDKSIEEKIESSDGDSKFYYYGKSIDAHRQELEEKANRLRNYVLYGDKSIEKAANAKPYSENPFLKAMRELDYKNQLRAACRITEDLYRTRIGKQLLGDLLFYPPYRFIDFFDDPAKKLPDFTLDLPSQKETLIKPLADSYLILKNGAPTGKLKRETNAVVMKLSTLATRLLPGVTQIVSQDPDDIDTKQAAQRAIGTILYPFFDSPKLWDDSQLSVPAADVLLKLRQGSLSWSDVTSLGGALVGKIEGGVGIIDDTDEWKNLPDGSAWAAGLKSIVAGVGGALHAIESFEKIKNDNYQASDTGQTMIVLYKTAVDTTVAESVIKGGRETLEGARKVALQGLGVVADGIDAIQYYQSSWANYARNDFSVARGYGLAGWGAATSFVAGVLGIVTSLSGVGLAVVGLVGIAMQVTGLSIATFTQDSWILRWFRNSAWGKNYEKGLSTAQVPTTPGKMAYRYDVDGASIEEEFSRMNGSYYGKTTDISVSYIDFAYNSGPLPSYLEVTFNNIVVNSATDIVVRPIFHKGNENYEYRDRHHIVHLRNKELVTDSDVKVSLDVPSRDYDSQTTATLRISEDDSMSSSTVKDVVGIEASEFDTRGGHYVEIGIIASELKGKLTKEMGTILKRPSSSTSSPSALPYDTVPIMARSQEEL